MRRLTRAAATRVRRCSILDRARRDAPRGYVDADAPLGGPVGDMLLHKDILAPLPAVNTVLCDIAFPVSSCVDTDRQH